MHLIPIKTIIRDALKGGKPDTNSYNPHGKNNQSKKKTQVCS